MNRPRPRALWLLAPFLALLLAATGALAMQRALDRPTATEQDALPADANYIASSRGTVYYWRGCSQWRRLSPANLRFFKTAEDAERAGYVPSRTRGCAGPPGGVSRPSTADGRGRPALGDSATTAPNVPDPSRATQGCRVQRVVDGDTLVCVGGVRLRLLLVDAPEAGQGASGARATSVLRALAPPGTALGLEYDVQRRDRYGRDLVYAYLADGRMVNVELARAGVAVIGIYPPNVRYVEVIRAAVAEAREARRGLWSGSAFDCAPADFRRGRCDD